jgi:AcrR family transcriptional regulator
VSTGTDPVTTARSGAVTEPVGGGRAVGLRERKKAERFRTIASAARQLTLDRGLDAVSIEEISAAADVSPRTFHNYYSCKEEAIVGIEPSGVAATAAYMRDRPADETPFEALRALILHAPDQLSATGEEWVRRTELLRRHPSLLPFYLAGLARTEEALVAALADRVGVDPARDPLPSVLVSATLASTRATIRWWHDHEPSMSLAEALEDSLGALALGFGRVRS